MKSQDKDQDIDMDQAASNTLDFSFIKSFQVQNQGNRGHMTFIEINRAKSFQHDTRIESFIKDLLDEDDLLWYAVINTSDHSENFGILAEFESFRGEESIKSDILDKAKGKNISILQCLNVKDKKGIQSKCEEKKFDFDYKQIREKNKPEEEDGEDDEDDITDNKFMSQAKGRTNTKKSNIKSKKVNDEEIPKKKAKTKKPVSTNKIQEEEDEDGIQDEDNGKSKNHQTKAKKKNNATKKKENLNENDIEIDDIDSHLKIKTDLKTTQLKGKDDHSLKERTYYLEELIIIIVKKE